jgi:signal peptidase I
MGDAALSIFAVVLLILSSTTGAVAASRVVDGSGASMRPTLCDGSLVTIDRTETPAVGDVVVVNYGSSRVTHRVVRTAPDFDHVDGETVREPGVDYVTAGTNSGGVDVDEVWHTPGRGETIDYADTEQVLGVVDRVIYDGCGPL